jgi:hypothetical protein
VWKLSDSCHQTDAMVIGEFSRGLELVARRWKLFLCMKVNRYVYLGMT